MLMTGTGMERIYTIIAGEKAELRRCI